MIRKISGKTKSPNYTHLNHVGAETKPASKADIADTLGETFANNSSPQNYTEKSKMNKRKLNSISNPPILKIIINFLILMNFQKQ